MSPFGVLPIIGEFDTGLVVEERLRYCAIDGSKIVPFALVVSFEQTVSIIKNGGIDNRPRLVGTNGPFRKGTIAIHIIGTNALERIFTDPGAHRVAALAAKSGPRINFGRIGNPLNAIFEGGNDPVPNSITERTNPFIVGGLGARRAGRNRGFTDAKPRGDGIIGGSRTRKIGADRTFFEVTPDGGVIAPGVKSRRVPFDCAENAMVILESRLLAILGLVTEQRDPNREFISKQDLVEVGGAPVRTKGAKLKLNSVGILESSAIQAGVDDTGGTADTEQNRIRSALKINPTDIIRVPRNIGEEEIAGVVRLGQTASARGLDGTITTGSSQLGPITESEEIAALTSHFGPGRVDEQVLCVVGFRVLEELLGNHLYGGTHIPQFCADTGARQSVLRGVAGIFTGFNDEG